MREHRSQSDVADALDVDTGVELVVDHDAPAQINFDANVFEVEAFDVWPATDGNENNICIELIRVPDMPSMFETRELKATHRLLLSVLCGLRHDNHLPIYFFAKRTIVLNLNLRPCLANDCWNCFLSNRFASRNRNTDNRKMRGCTRFPRRFQHPQYC